MSYCGPGGSQGRWISAWNYENLIGFIANPGTGSGNNGGDGDYLLFSASIGPDGVSVEPNHLIEFNGNPVLFDEGDYRAVLRDFSGATLAEAYFEAESGVLDGPDPGESYDESVYNRLVTVALPKPDVPIAELAIFKDEVEIDLVQASPNPPTVNITEPAQDAWLDTEQVTFAWNGTDLDEDPLIYTIQFSADDGQTWHPLAVNHSEQSLVLDRSDLVGSNSARFRVAVSDGINTSIATSDVFRVAQNAPQIFITEPGFSGHNFDSSQSILFRATSSVAEDGVLADSSVSWRVNNTDSLGIGNTLLLPFANLGEGAHIITATATDSDGAAASDSIIVLVDIEGDSGILRAIQVVKQFDQGVFKSRGHRKIVLNSLKIIKKAIQKNHPKIAIFFLKLIERHTDGCAARSVPDKNDWIVQCPIQQILQSQIQIIRQDIDVIFQAKN
jgi:hypothetical protein